jgi:hypothetical protein
MTKDEALKLALEALVIKYSDAMYDALGAGISTDFELDVEAIKQALAAPAFEVCCGAPENCDRPCVHRGIWLATPPAQPAPVQEPVAIYQYQLANGSWIDQDKSSYDYNVRLNQATIRIVYTTPPAAQRQWVGLTDDEWDEFSDKYGMIIFGGLKQEIEAKLKERNQ